MLVPGAGRIQVAHQGIRSLLRQTLGADLGGSVAPGPAVGDQDRSRCHPVHGLRQLRAADPRRPGWLHPGAVVDRVPALAARHSATSPSALSTWPAAPISPKPPDRPHAPWTGPSPTLG